MAKKRKFSHKPFAGLDLRAPEEQADDTDAAAQAASEPDLGEDALALAELAEGTEPLGDQPLAERRAAARPLPEEADDSASVMRELDELVHGTVPFDFAGTDEFIEAAAQGVDRRIVRKLRRGEYSVQAHLDLHGYNRREARQLVGSFIERVHAEDKRCVLIVHGRGLGSKEGIPVLKQKLASWLTRGAIGRKVLAYTSARPYDGGAGAVYVLLRG